MSRRLLIITQRVDETDDLLGFFVSWIREFAKHFDHVDVIALKGGTYTLPAHVSVHVLGKNKKFSFLHLLWKHTPRHGVVFCHMSPIFAVAAWLLAYLRGSRLVLWYLHRANTFRLRLALRVSDFLVTADAASLTIRSPKIISVGHGIDVQRFMVTRDWGDINQRPLRIIGVGRLSPIKDFATFIHAIAVLKKERRDVQLRIVGRPVMASDHAYAQSLYGLVAHLGLQDTIQFVGFIPYRDMPAQYAWADMAVGCTPHGGIDKTLLEAMAAGCLVLTSNEVMRTHLGECGGQFIFTYGDPASLARAIGQLRNWETTSAEMVRQVSEHHDLSGMITRIVHLI